MMNNYDDDMVGLDGGHGRWEFHSGKLSFCSLFASDHKSIISNSLDYDDYGVSKCGRCWNFVSKVQVKMLPVVAL